MTKKAMQQFKRKEMYVYKLHTITQPREMSQCTSNIQRMISQPSKHICSYLIEPVLKSSGERVPHRELALPAEEKHSG